MLNVCRQRKERKQRLTTSVRRSVDLSFRFISDLQLTTTLFYLSRLTMPIRRVSASTQWWRMERNAVSAYIYSALQKAGSHSTDSMPLGTLLFVILVWTVHGWLGRGNQSACAHHVVWCTLIGSYHRTLRGEQSGCPPLLLMLSVQSCRFWLQFQLDKLLDCQHMVTREHCQDRVHDEHLFIITHQGSVRSWAFKMSLGADERRKY